MKNLSSTAQRSLRYEQGRASVEYMLTGIVVISVAMVIFPLFQSVVVENITTISESLAALNI